MVRGGTRDADHQARGRDDAVVGAEHRRPKPVEPRGQALVVGLVVVGADLGGRPRRCSWSPSSAAPGCSATKASLHWPIRETVSHRRLARPRAGHHCRHEHGRSHRTPAAATAAAGQPADPAQPAPGPPRGPARAGRRRPGEGAGRPGGGPRADGRGRGRGHRRGARRRTHRDGGLQGHGPVRGLRSRGRRSHRRRSCAPRRWRPSRTPSPGSGCDPGCRRTPSTPCSTDPWQRPCCDC